jgi:hypothetical protein
MNAPALRPLSTGEILDVSFGLYRQRFGPLVKVALLTAAVPMLIEIYVTTAGGQFANLGLSLANLFLKTVLSLLALGATIFIVSESDLGHDLSAADALKRSVPFLGRLVLLSILLGLVIGVGFLLFIIPGCVFLAGLVASVPALVLENHQSALEAMARGWGLSRGFRRKQFVIVATVFILQLIPVVAAGFFLPEFSSPAAAYELEGGSGSASIILGLALILQVLISPFVYCTVTVAYYDLRVRKEGFDLEILAARLQPA